MKQTEKNTKTAVIEQSTSNEAVAQTHTFQDLKNSVLIISVFANMVIFTAWVALQVTTQFDGQFANLLFTR
jgi:hypothetical protein